MPHPPAASARRSTLPRHAVLGPLPALLAGALLAWSPLIAGCASGPEPIDDPVAVLEDPDRSNRAHLAALEVLESQPPDDASNELLKRMIWASGWSIEVREQAVDLLAERDHDALQTTIRQRLPRTVSWPWLTRLCEIVGERGWSEQTPALVSSWGRPTDDGVEEWSRPEAKAMADLHGRDQVVDEIFAVMMAADRPSDQGLRTRCWDLLQRLDQRDRLVELLAEHAGSQDDLFLADLSAAARDFGLIPANREEILWLRSIRQPEHGQFWAEATAAVQALTPERRAALEIRDLPVLVAAARHDPSIMNASRDELYRQVQQQLGSVRRHPRTAERDGRGATPETVERARGQLTWGDLAAIKMATTALAVPQVASHLFDFAERDRTDTTTEYGGVIRLDDEGRFEVLEFPPRVRQHDLKFIAPQEMFDAGYTAQFHFHYHAQEHRNGVYAGPGLGDWKYANNTRANCLVFTFIDERTLNVDYYRHGRVIVDLGTIRRG